MQLSHLHVAVSPSCSQQALRVRSLCMLKIPCPPFNKRKPKSQWHRHTQVVYNGSRMIKIMVVATPDGRGRTESFLSAQNSGSAFGGHVAQDKYGL